MIEPKQVEPAEGPRKHDQAPDQQDQARSSDQPVEGSDDKPNPGSPAG